MTESPAPITPTVNVPLSDAVQELTGFEALAVQKRTGRKLEELGGIELTIGVVWAYMNRDGQKTPWTTVEAMTFRQLTAFFAAEPDDIDESEPDSEAGKGGLYV